MTKPKGGRPRRKGPTKQMLWKDLAVIGVVPDMYLSMSALKQLRAQSYAFLPGGQIGDGVPNTYVEIFGAMLRSHGFVDDDIKEAFSEVWNTGQAFHWSEIPDFDKGAEDKGEKNIAKGISKQFLRLYEFADKERKKMHNEEKSNLKDQAAFHSAFR
jgi:hypothetical protein